MEAAAGAETSRAKTLPVILLAAVVQGWALYALHLAVAGGHWPAGNSAWLLALYAVAISVPTTVQLTAEHVRNAVAWKLIALIAVAFFYFGWHHGTWVAVATEGRFVEPGGSALVLLVLWLTLLPFVQARLASGQWRAQYETLFATAWRNKLILAEAALFTGLLWMLLSLWAALFKMLGIEFFRELFHSPIFAYPVTALSFGLAMHLIGSVERFTGIVLQQLLSVLKWLAIIAGLILALFTLALLFELPALLSAGERAIGAEWLLWLMAVIVLLLNAGYRDGSVEAPYPRWMGLALRWVIPLTIVVASTAVYALYLRVASRGFTVDRVWAVIVAGLALVYAVGYTIAAWGRGAGRGHWMAGISRVNITAALLLIGVLALTLTPVLSPYRIAAASQYDRALLPIAPVKDENASLQTPLQYLRFDAGQYGERRLRELAQLQEHPRAAQIRAAATRALEQKERWAAPLLADPEATLAEIPIYPQGRSVDPALREQLLELLRQSVVSVTPPDLNLAGLYVELNGDGVDEFVLLTSKPAWVFALREGQWRRIGTMYSSTVRFDEILRQHLVEGRISTQPQAWKELYIGPFRYSLNPDSP
jgi:Domain of unknown function (DUF4153)